MDISVPECTSGQPNLCHFTLLLKGGSMSPYTCSKPSIYELRSCFTPCHANCCGFCCNTFLPFLFIDCMTVATSVDPKPAGHWGRWELCKGFCNTLKHVEVIQACSRQASLDAIEWQCIDLARTSSQQQLACELRCSITTELCKG